MTLEDKVHGLRLQVIQRAETLGNIGRACREAGISRALFYRWRVPCDVERWIQDMVRSRKSDAMPYHEFESSISSSHIPNGGL